jgi:5'(3')-deoxyribonucleotidase
MPRGRTDPLRAALAGGPQVRPPRFAFESCMNDDVEASRTEPGGPKVALFDMDGSLADFDGATIADLNRLRSPAEPLTPVNFRELDRFRYMRARMHLIHGQPGWWRKLGRIESGFTVLRLAEKIGFEINILTKGPRSHPQAWAEKLEWCQAQPELRTRAVHITVNKALVYGVMLFDDYPAYMDAWLAHRPRGLGIMPATPNNGGYEHPRVVRWDGKNIAEVERAMRAAYQREIGTPLVLNGTNANVALTSEELAGDDVAGDV